MRPINRLPEWFRLADDTGDEWMTDAATRKGRGAETAAGPRNSLFPSNLGWLLRLPGYSLERLHAAIQKKTRCDLKSAQRVTNRWLSGTIPNSDYQLFLAAHFKLPNHLDLTERQLWPDTDQPKPNEGPRTSRDELIGIVGSLPDHKVEALLPAVRLLGSDGHQ